MRVQREPLTQYRCLYFVWQTVIWGYVLTGRIHRNRNQIKPLLDMIKQHGFNEARRMIEKAYLRDKLLQQEKDSMGRILPRTTSFRGDKPVEAEAVIPGHGVITLQTQELTPSHITLLATVYRSTCNFAEQAGGDPQLIETCRQEATQLESYVEPQPDQAQEGQEGEEQT